ncbi:MAG: transporter substrate-binding domain-containing protein [Halarcobacter sp.]
MKKIVRFLLLFTYFSSFLCASSVNFTDKEKEYIKNSPKVKIGSMDTYIPFSFIKNGKKVGFTQDLISVISEKSGLKFEVVDGNWTKLYNLFIDSKIDVISEFSYKKNRLSFTNYTDPYYEIPIGVFTRSDFKSYTGIESLKNKKVGVVKNSYIEDILKKENIKVVEFNSSNERFYALNEKKVDVVLANVMTIYKLENLMLPNIKLAGRFVHPDAKSEDLRFGIRKDKPILASIINKTLNSIPFSKISQIKQDWILSLNNQNIEIDLSKKEKKWISENKIKVGIEQAKPYIYYDNKKEKYSGLYFDILQKVLEKTGLKVEYTHAKWSELLNQFKEKKLDLLPATFYSKQREKFGLFSDEYYKVREYIYISQDNNEINNFKDLEGKKVAIIKGYATIDKIKKRFPNINIIETSGLDESTSKVLNKEVDALIDYHLVVDNYIRDNSIVGLKDIAQNDLDAVSVHFLSNIDKPILQSILQKGLNSISRQEMNEVLKKWVQTPYNSEDKKDLLTENEKEFIIRHQKIRFGITSDRPPFEFEQNGKAVGIAIDYIKISAKNVGLDIEFIINKMPISKAYDSIENNLNNFDTIPFSVKSKKRISRFSYGKSYLSYPMMIIKHKDSSYIGSLKDLENKTIVLEDKYLTNKWIKRDYPNIKIVNVKNTKEALIYLNEGKVDAYVGNLAVANYMSIFGGLENIKVAAPSGYGNIKYNFVAPKEWPELASILSKGFDQISQSEHSAIQQKWFSLQTVEKIDYSLIWKIVFISLFIIIWILWWNRKITIEKNRTKDALDQLQLAKSKLEQKNIEVQESKDFLSSVIDESPDLIVLKNIEGKFLLVNKAFAKLFNCSTLEIIGKYDSDFDDKRELIDFFNKEINETFAKQETKVKNEVFKDNLNGELKHYITTKKPFISENGENLILIIVHDITIIKKLEDEQLKQQELLLNQSKIAAMGEMLGNISHQWRQPLSVITTQVSSINVWIDLGMDVSLEKIKEYNKNVIKQANYLSKTIDDFRNFFISDSTTKQIYNLKEVFIKVEDLISIPFENNFIETFIDVDDDIEVELNENILIQALINIYNNTKDAFVEKNIDTDDRFFFVTIKKENNESVITFKDSAGGIKEDSIDKIFEPYFTTKHQSIGTGIGLYMTNQIVVKHLKGTIEAINEVYEFNNKSYKGAKFIMRLPLANSF